MTGPGATRVRWRLLVHALDRTGPPMLARSLARWLARHHPELTLDVVAFRGGPLEADMAELGTVVVMLEDQEPWDHDAPDPDRAREVRARTSALPAADLTILVSVAAGQCLPFVPDDQGPVATWSVEVDEDLHWIDAPLGLRDRTDTWLAGSEATARHLTERWDIHPAVIPELIEDPSPTPPEAVAAIRDRLGVAPDEVLVLGAGIGTHRKGLDLFVEVALAQQREAGPVTRFAWVGGEADPLHPRVRTDLRRLGIDHLELVASVADLDPWCAAADVLLHPARRDAFPLVCLHAAAAGTPVVSFAGASGAEEMFGADALVAPYPDVAGLAGLVAGLDGPRRRREVGERQRERVRTRHLVSVAGPVVHRALVEAARPAPGSRR